MSCSFHNLANRLRQMMKAWRVTFEVLLDSLRPSSSPLTEAQVAWRVVERKLLALKSAFGTKTSCYINGRDEGISD